MASALAPPAARLALTGLALLLVGAGPAPGPGWLPAAAPPQSARLAVLPVLVGERADLTVGQAFSGVQAASAFRPVQPMSVDDYFFQDGKELSGRALACGGDTGCLAAELAVFRADLGLVLIGNAEVEPPLLGLVLVDTARRAVLAERYGNLDPSPFEAQIRSGVDALLDEAGLPRAGQLELIVEPAGARLEVGDGLPPEPGAAYRFSLRPGTYPVRVSAADHRTLERTVDIAPGEVTRLDVQLEREQSFWASPWLWAGVAAVVVGAGATAAVVAADQPQNCLCVTAAGDGMCITCP